MAIYEILFLLPWLNYGSALLCLTGLGVRNFIANFIPTRCETDGFGVGENEDLGNVREGRSGVDRVGGLLLVD